MTKAKAIFLTDLSDLRGTVNILDGEETGEAVEKEFDQSRHELRVGHQHARRLLNAVLHGSQAFHGRIRSPTLRQSLHFVPDEINR